MKIKKNGSTIDWIRNNDIYFTNKNYFFFFKVKCKEKGLDES